MPNKTIPEIILELGRYRYLCGDIPASNRLYYIRAAQRTRGMSNPDQASVDEILGGTSASHGNSIVSRDIESILSGRWRFIERAFPPESVFTMTTIPGIGDSRAYRFYLKYGIRSRADLLSRFQKHTLDHEMDKIVRVAFCLLDTRVPRADIHVQRAVSIVSNTIKQVAPGSDVRCVGSYRRRMDTVGDLDFLCLGSPSASIHKSFQQLGEPLVRGRCKSSILYRLDDRGWIRIDLLVISNRLQWGSALCYFTGGDEHNKALRYRAKQQGLVLNERGLWSPWGNVLQGGTESEVYRILGIVPTPPWLRSSKLRIAPDRIACHPYVYFAAQLLGIDVLQQMIPESVQARVEIKAEFRSQSIRKSHLIQAILRRMERCITSKA